MTLGFVGFIMYGNDFTTVEAWSDLHGSKLDDREDTSLGAMVVKLCGFVWDFSLRRSTPQRPTTIVRWSSTTSKAIKIFKPNNK